MGNAQQTLKKALMIPFRQAELRAIRQHRNETEQGLERLKNRVKKEEAMAEQIHKMLGNNVSRLYAERASIHSGQVDQQVKDALSAQFGASQVKEKSEREGATVEKK